MKIAINRCFGEFSLSPKALKYWMELKGNPCYFFTYSHNNKKDEYEPIEIKDIKSFNWSAFTIKNPVMFDNDADYIDNCPEDRTDNELIITIENLGDKANGGNAKLKVIEIPDDVEWEIDEYDGMETVREKHRSWF